VTFSVPQKIMRQGGALPTDEPGAFFGSVHPFFGLSQIFFPQRRENEVGREHARYTPLGNPSSSDL